MSKLGVTQCHWKLHTHTSLYSYSIATIALSCIISEIKQDIGGKSRLFNITAT